VVVIETKRIYSIFLALREGAYFTSRILKIPTLLNIMKLTKFYVTEKTC